MKKFNLFKMLAVLIVLITSINTAWAYNLERAYLKYSFNGSESTFGVTNDEKYTYDAGTLTGSFDIKGIYIISSTGSGDDWTGGKMGYTIYHNGSETSESNVQPNTHRGYGYNTNADSERQDEWEGTINITSSTSNSGIYYFKFYFVSYFGYGKDIYKPNGTSKEIKYTILPPNVSDFTITPSGILSGSGTSDDPYIIPNNGTLTLTLSNASQAHPDENSSAEYSVDGGSTWGTDDDYTSYTISNITDIDVQNYVFKARYNNSDESLTGAIKEKTIYYKTAPWVIAGTMNSWNTDNQPIAHFSSGTGYVDITLAANQDYTFKVKNRTNDEWYGQEHSDGTMIYPRDNNNTWQFTNPGHDCKITTAGAGTYRFTWNSNDKQLTVTYPTSYTVTFGYGDHGTTVTASGSISGSITSGQFVTAGENVEFTETHATGYKLKGWYTAESGGSAVGTMGSGDNVLNGIAVNANVYAQYEGNDFTVRFNANYPSGAVNNGASMDNQAFVYATAQNISANAFACEGYTFTGWKKDNATSGDDVTAGSDGSTLSTTDGATVNLYAQWEDNGKYYYKGASPDGWNTASYWTRNAVPGSTDDVIVLTALNAPSGTTTVNSVRIATSGTYTPVGGSGITANGSLTIPGSAALKVVTNVANCTISDNEPTSGTSTTSSTLEIDASGALAWNGGGSPGDARVGFHTVSGGVPGSKEAVNEYIGIPFTSLSSDAYYNAWVFQVSGETWAEVSGATLVPWTGYNIIEKKEVSGTTGGSYSLTGELVSSSASLGSGATAGSETLYANSWVAPIEISQIGYSGTGTIYTFNASSLKALEDAGKVGDAKGNYSSITINEAVGRYIRSMQSFSVWSGTTISINYATAVYGEIAAGKNAPRRERTTDYRQAIWDTQDSLFVNVKSASGWGDDLQMFIHSDFSQNYENGWDGPKMEGMWEAPKLYTLNNEGEMAVSCVPSADNNVIAFHAGTASNEYTFTFKYSGEDELILKDTKTGIETPIVNGGTYEFTSNTSDDDLRFVIKKVSNAATGVDEIGGNANGVQKIMCNGTMYILREGRIYSAEGAFVK